MTGPYVVVETRSSHPDTVAIHLPTTWNVVLAAHGPLHTASLYPTRQELRELYESIAPMFAERGER